MLPVLASVPTGVAGTIEGIIPADAPVGVAFPVCVPLAGGNPEALTAVVHIGSGTDAREIRSAAQREPDFGARDDTARAWFWLTLGARDRGQSIRVRIGPSPRDAESVPAYRADYADPLLHVLSAAGGEPVLTFWHGDADRGNREGYPLNDFIHPLLGLDGEVLTASSPGDHIHHRGIFWAWVRNERGDAWKGDWWMPIRIHAEPRSLAYEDGPVFTCMHSVHHWVYQENESTGQDPYVEERLVARIFDTTDHGRIIDLDLALTGIGEGVRIGGQLAKDKGYSGMTVRFADAVDILLEKQDRVVHAATVNHLRAKWIDWTGVFVGPDGDRLDHPSGAALMVHPSHPDYPPEWITRYYGPINVAYPGLDMLDLPEGRPLHLRYRLWVHRGRAAEGRVSEQYAAYTADWNWRTSEQ